MKIERDRARPVIVFADVLDACQEEILRYLVRLTGRPGEAEDLFQETFLRGFAAFGRLADNANHRAWLYRIATNVFLNHVRTATRRKEVAIEGDFPDAAPSQERRHASANDGLVFRKALMRLPARQRVAFIQRHYHELRYEAVAASLGCSPAAARANVYQAIRRLRAMLRKAGVER